MQKKPLYVHLAVLVQAIRNCQARPDDSVAAYWLGVHTDKLEGLVKNHMPSGSGIDSGVKIQLPRCNDKFLAFESSYHMMDENGSYCGWMDFLVHAHASLQSGIDVDVHQAIGADPADYDKHADYLSEVFQTALTAEVEA
jgi:hypothetical protein